MRSSVLTFLAVLLISCAAFGQTPAPSPTPTPALNNLYAVGLSFNSGGKPAIAGTGLYAHLIASDGTYAFTVVDALPINVKPFSVTTNIGGGIAQKVLTIQKIPIFVPTSAGISYTGQNTGWSWSTGAVAFIRLKNGLVLLPNVRVQKSSVSSGANYQPIVGVMFGWGN